MGSPRCLAFYGTYPNTFPRRRCSARSVVTEMSTGFERGMLHVDVDGSHYIVVHLNAHSAEKRVAEAGLVAGVVVDILAEVCSV